MTEHHGTKFFWIDIHKYFFKKFTLVLLDGFLNGFSKFQFFIVEICTLIRDFWVIFENYSMRMLSIRGNDFLHTEHTRKRFHRTLSIQGTNFRGCSASGNIWTVFTCKSMLSIRGTNFIANWAYAERTSWLAEHTRNGFHRWLSIHGNNVLKSNISAESNTIFKNLVLQALGTIRFRFLQKIKKKFMLVYL